METQRLAREQFRELFPGHGRAFHLELRDAYGVADEDGPFRKWLQRQPDDFEWHTSWLNFARDVIGRGTTIQRARVVTEPLTDYIRWEMSIDPQNLEAGEDIRYLPRQAAEDIQFPNEDYWLFDDDALVLSLFMHDGTSAGFALVSDPVLLKQCRVVRDQVWSRAVPYARYAA
ncbi:DUF6879 family protein [Streptosporangium sp. G11]|uniref:DUF6879 family protein n=1 Tax=Streptosporangium sp. G11 TaxID=3436926 RepID=UPI003EC0AE80